jgi:hypothetical protein
VTGAASIYPSRYAAMGEHGVESLATAYLFEAKK